ncbi:transmembrane protein 145-like isoform X1 [Dinothrombium tinctorium]|uniref:Transmembrane protein 145-like isoform X1 n=1 Tax=Dinothrombium tinctorium TaxID=1965070 RepID=A0A443R819_9ACAR|nr:transmembrane protein 145-like isoform X1 [Dinothrombium tinctorium]
MFEKELNILQCGKGRNMSQETIKSSERKNSIVIGFKEYATQNILLYFDEPFQWAAVYKNESKTCDEKISVLNKKNNQIIQLDEIDKLSGCEKGFGQYDGSVINIFNCSSSRTFRTKRERWWYLAVSNCKSNKGLRLKYSIIMINNQSQFLKHFSADQYYIIHTDLTFLGLYIVLFIVCCVQSYFLSARRLFHVTYKLYLLSVIYELTGISFLCAYYLIYAQNGQAANGYLVTGKGFNAMSSVIFLLLLILLSKGYTVTRARLKSFSSATIAVFITIYFTIYALLFLFENLFFDPGEVLYTYESIFGYGLIVLRLIGLIAFTYFSYKTVLLYPSKKGFFIILYIMYCVWFVSIPIVIIMATTSIPKYMREQVVNGFELGVAFRAHLFFMAITWPTKFNTIFPFHVRTNQIMAMTKTGQAGDDTLDKFTHYQYAPKRPQTQQTMQTPQSLEMSEINNTTTNARNGFHNSENNKQPYLYSYYDSLFYGHLNAQSLNKTLPDVE